MREIKYRYVWESGKPVLITTEIFSIEQIEDGEMEDFIYAEQSELGESLKLIERNLYTGLNDKNGKEIYEGDIVKINYTPDIENAEEDFDITDVEWLEDDITCGWSIDPVTSWHAKVIGNIHENPELLGK